MKKFISSVLVGVLFVAGVAIAGDITARGMGQGDLYTFLSNVVTLVNELRTDHATSKAVTDDLKTLTNNLRTWTQAFPVTNPNFEIASNFDVQNGDAYTYAIAGQMYNVATDQAFDSGTAATFNATKWGIMLLSINAAGTETVTWSTNGTDGWDSEALAIANLNATPANHCPLGYVTVQAHGTGQFLAGTDALQGGSGGDVSADTNYYNMIDTQGVISAAVATSSPATVSASALSLTGL